MAPPYTFPCIVPPAILTFECELSSVLVPVAAALPPPNTEHWLKTVHCAVPIVDDPPIVIFVLLKTTASEPSPPP